MKNYTAVGVAARRAEGAGGEARPRGAGPYRWEPQECPVCRVPPSRRLGRRGGEAHRAGLGVACDVWRCGRCGLIFPDPMPVPVGGAAQHYGVPADEYFENHDLEVKGAAAAALLARARSLAGGAGRLLDVGSGRGERDYTHHLWTLLMLELWFQRFIDK